mmetsp:Transcript_39685/g.87118  ORF Transcript_39685/g.87118 Transcript_39685/m.87118 type:complete len:278 (-) Transcript_39685:688-1521(-)|eukprot:2486181-Pleurochrysis_carterae.AAC.3
MLLELRPPRAGEDLRRHLRQTGQRHPLKLGCRDVASGDGLLPIGERAAASLHRRFGDGHCALYPIKADVVAQFLVHTSILAARTSVRNGVHSVTFLGVCFKWPMPKMPTTAVVVLALLPNSMPKTCVCRFAKFVILACVLQVVDDLGAVRAVIAHHLRAWRLVSDTLRPVRGSVSAPALVQPSAASTIRGCEREKRVRQRDDSRLRAGIATQRCRRSATSGLRSCRGCLLFSYPCAAHIRTSAANRSSCNIDRGLNTTDAPTAIASIAPKQAITALA